jgi:hypothetical protein
MSCCNEITVTVENKPVDNVNVYIDETGVGVRPLLNFIYLLSSNFNTQQQVMSTILANSSVWQETYNELNTIQPLSSNWVETFEEVNLIQNSLSSNWQKTFEYVEAGILINGGTF